MDAADSGDERKKELETHAKRSDEKDSNMKTETKEDEDVRRLPNANETNTSNIKRTRRLSPFAECSSHPLQAP